MTHIEIRRAHDNAIVGHAETPPYWPTMVERQQREYLHQTAFDRERETDDGIALYAVVMDDGQPEGGE